VARVIKIPAEAWPRQQARILLRMLEAPGPRTAGLRRRRRHASTPWWWKVCFPLPSLAPLELFYSSFLSLQYAFRSVVLYRKEMVFLYFFLLSVIYVYTVFVLYLLKNVFFLISVSPLLQSSHRPGLGMGMAELSTFRWYSPKPIKRLRLMLATTMCSFPPTHSERACYRGLLIYLQKSPGQRYLQIKRIRPAPGTRNETELTPNKGLQDREGEISFNFS
jgi:hypothetical protein